VKRKTRKNERANSKIVGKAEKKKQKQNKTKISEAIVAYNLQQNKQSRHYLSRNQSGAQQRAWAIYIWSIVHQEARVAATCNPRSSGYTHKLLEKVT